MSFENYRKTLVLDSLGFSKLLRNRTQNLSLSSDLQDKSSTELASPPGDYTKSLNASNQASQQDMSKNVSQLIGNIVKHSNANYVHASNTAKKDPLEFRKQKCFRRIRPTMSADRYQDILKAVMRMDNEQLLGWINQTEKHMDRIQHGHR